jgi:beta-phosphoglucomutase-like phosphatase (HAD superfamily)
VKEWLPGTGNARPDRRASGRRAASLAAVSGGDIDRLRDEGKKVALVHDGERADAALEIAGVAERFDAVVRGPRNPATVERALKALGAPAGRAVVVDVSPAGLEAAVAAGARLAIAVARGSATPEQLRHTGAAAVVADLQELLGPT